MSVVFQPRWYLCDIVDRFELESLQEPDWSRVPEAKRERVRASYEKARDEKLKPSRWLMWGPQIPWYGSQAQYDVVVVS